LLCVSPSFDGRRERLSVSSSLLAFVYRPLLIAAESV
jgi:hypothetical protein